MSTSNVPSLPTVHLCYTCMCISESKIEEVCKSKVIMHEHIKRTITFVLYVCVSLKVRSKRYVRVR